VWLQSLVPPGAVHQPRVDDDPVESKRVEILSMPLADNQPMVRLRFAHAGANSWYWGVRRRSGSYSLPSLNDKQHRPKRFETSSSPGSVS